MDTGIWVTLLTALLAFLGGGGGKWIFDLIKQKSDNSLQQEKQNSDIRFSEMEKAFTIYKEIVESLKRDAAALGNSFQVMEKEYIATREKNAELNSKLEMRNTQNEEMKVTISELKAEIMRLKPG